MASQPNAAQKSAIEAAAHILQRAVQRASTDPDLRRRLVADPRTVLAEQGLVVPAGVVIEFEETVGIEAEAVIGQITASRVVVPLPPLRDALLSDNQLDAVVGGVDFRATALYYAITPLAVARALILGGDADSG